MPFDTVTSDSVEFQAYQDYFGKPIDTNEGLIGETILMNCKTTGNTYNQLTIVLCIRS